MKKFTKWSLIVCLGLFCVGAVCAGVGLARGLTLGQFADLFSSRGWVRLIQEEQVTYREDQTDRNGGGTEEGSESTQGGAREMRFSPSELRELEVSLLAGELTVEFTEETEEIVVEVRSDSSEVDCRVDEGTLKVEDRRQNWSEVLSLGTELRVQIPAGTLLEEVDLNVDAGTAAVTGTLQARESISLSVGAGEITAESVQAHECSVDVGAGQIVLDRCQADELEVSVGAGEASVTGEVVGKGELDCSMGSIYLALDGGVNDYNYDIDCGMGEIRMEGLSIGGLSVTKQIDNRAACTLELDCSMGEITLAHAG